MPPLRIAALACTATADVRANQAVIAAAITQAAAQQAQLLVTPECALCGYPVATGALAADSCELSDAEERLLLLAERVRIGLILGSAGADGNGGARNLAVIGGTLPARTLAKRILTPADRAWFTPGPDVDTLIEIGGWRVAVGICYEIRQAGWWYAAAAAGADAAVVLAHQAGIDADPGTKAAVLPALHAARAAELAMPLVLANTAAADRWLDSAMWDARGVRTMHCAEGLMVGELRHRAQLDPWYETVRRDALAARR